MECMVKDVNINYEVFGEGRPLVAVHGFYPDRRVMIGCLEPVFGTRTDWQRIYLDLPGMGSTPPADWIKSTDDMLEVLMGFIDQVIPGSNFALAGESYGGYLARAVTRKMSERVTGLLQICPMIIPDSSKRTLPSLQVIVEDPELIASLNEGDREDFTSMTVVQTRAVWERTQREIYSGVGIANEEFLEKLRANRYACSWNVDPSGTTFEKPTLFLLGRQDVSTGYADALRIIENYPRGTFAILDRSGHNLQIEQENLFNALVHEWIDRVDEELARLQP